MSIARVFKGRDDAFVVFIDRRMYICAASQLAELLSTALKLEEQSFEEFEESLNV